MFGFTESESKIIVFLVVTLMIGMFVKFIKDVNNNQNLLQFDYNTQDSMFYRGTVFNETEEKSEKNIEKGVDSKRELLDFNGAKLAENYHKKPALTVEMININVATVDELCLLPGIGSKTAAAIVKFRNVNGRFKSADDLMDVKGIGKSKFEKIKKHIVVQ